MALVLLQSGVQPLGQFDALDADLGNFKGGEICTWTPLDPAGTDKAASDVFDGYAGTSSKRRPAVTLTVSSSARPLFLSDDGTSGYGTLFGSIVGSTAGQKVSGGTVLGPSTALGSGKVTLWDKPGLYGVTLDACDTAADGLKPKSSTTLTVGTTLTYTSGGLLTPVGSAGAVGSAPVVARLVEFATNGSLVNTPQSLVANLNSPSGSVSSLAEKTFAMAVIWFQCPTLT